MGFTLENFLILIAYRMSFDGVDSGPMRSVAHGIK